MARTKEPPARTTRHGWHKNLAEDKRLGLHPVVPSNIIPGGLSQRQDPRISASRYIAALVERVQ
jgi:hypothetical protein